MKGIILAGGHGSRLLPITQVISKQLLPIYDKPMIYYPLSTLMLSGITEILIVTTSRDKRCFELLLGDGSALGINISYETQSEPRGLPDALVVGENFVGDDDVCLILGDNIFHADTFINSYILPNIQSGKSTIFGYFVSDPERYGVVELDKKGSIISIEEKPSDPRSNYAITGLYIFDNRAIEVAKSLTPSTRGETEITDLIKFYVSIGEIHVELLGRGVAWLDTGTHTSFYDASNYIQVLEKRQGLKIGCIEEIAYSKGYITKDELINLAKPLMKTTYGQYLLSVVGLS